MGDEILEGRSCRGTCLGVVSLGASLLALCVSLWCLLRYDFHMRPMSWELEKLRALANVPKMHNTIDEEPTADPATRECRLRLLTVDTRPVEDLRVVIEVFQPGIALPPASDITIDPPYRAAISSEATQAVIRFDEQTRPASGSRSPSRTSRPSRRWCSISG
jgi:hypothetical protein